MLTRHIGTFQVDASSCKIGIYLITGTTKPASITIPACYQIQIRFHSDVSVQGAGFMLNYLSGKTSKMSSMSVLWNCVFITSTKNLQY